MHPAATEGVSTSAPGARMIRHMNSFSEEMHMRKAIFTRLAAPVAAVVAVLGFGLASASAAGAATVAVPNAVSHDTAGLAGQYKNNVASGWRYRDVKTTFTVTANMEQLGNTGSGPTAEFGGAGVRLCDANSDNGQGFGLDNGVIWNAPLSEFQAAVGFGDGVDATSTDPDPCVSTGAFSAPHVYPGSVNAAGVSIGDSITVETYYNPKTHWVTFTVTDNTTGFTSNLHCFAGYQNFYEAGVGVLDLNANALVGPAINPITAFTGSRATNYGAKSAATSLLSDGPAPGAVTALNGSNVPVVVPGPLTGGSAFSITA